MKAVVCEQYGAPEVLRVERRARPEPTAAQVLIRVRGSAVNSTDPVFRRGEPFVSRLFTGLRRPKHPIPGDVLAGEIVAVGRDVTRFAVGDRVYGATGMTLGAHAEYKCASAADALSIMPANLTFPQAAAIVDGALTALPFLRDKGRIRTGHKVLINGASGSVGTAAVQLAKHFGAEVTGVCSAANAELVRSLGADRVVDYTREDFTQKGERYDIIFDTVAKRTFCECRRALEDDGIYLSTFPAPRLMLHKLWTSLFGRQKADFAAAGMRPAAAKRDDLDFLRTLIEAGQLRAVVDREYTLERIVDAHRYVEAGHKRGNVTLAIA